MDTEVPDGLLPDAASSPLVGLPRVMAAAVASPPTTAPPALVAAPGANVSQVRPRGLGFHDARVAGNLFLNKLVTSGIPFTKVETSIGAGEVYDAYDDAIIFEITFQSGASSWFRVGGVKKWGDILGP